MDERLATEDPRRFRACDFQVGTGLEVCVILQPHSTVRWGPAKAGSPGPLGLQGRDFRFPPPGV